MLYIYCAQTLPTLRRRRNNNDDYQYTSKYFGSRWLDCCTHPNLYRSPWMTPLQETTASQLAVISVGCGWMQRRLHGMIIIMLYWYYSYSTAVVGI
jgi:hypothetical protein